MKKNLQKDALHFKSANELLARISSEFDIDIPSLKSNARFGHIAAARRAFCMRGRAAGISTMVLGIVIRWDHSTISYLANCPLAQAAE